MISHLASDLSSPSDSFLETQEYSVWTFISTFQTYESSKLAAVDMIMDRDQVLGVELESCGELRQELPGGIDELSEDWRHFFTVSCQESAAIRELVTKVKPIFLNESLVALQLRWSSF